MQCAVFYPIQIPYALVTPWLTQRMKSKASKHRMLLLGLIKMLQKPKRQEAAFRRSFVFLSIFLEWVRENKQKERLSGNQVCMMCAAIETWFYAGEHHTYVYVCLPIYVYVVTISLQIILLITTWVKSRILKKDFLVFGIFPFFIWRQYMLELAWTPQDCAKPYDPFHIKSIGVSPQHMHQ